MSHILGLDLGTNSVGWSIIDNEKNIIIDCGSRIIPMDAATIGNYEKGNIQSAANERTKFRGTRRLYERAILRRERLLRVLHVLNFLPKTFSDQIDFEVHPGQFKNHGEPLLPYYRDENGKSHFLFGKSFTEMIEDFKKHQPDLVSNGKLVPYDWTIYYLRKKALTQPISKEELSWIILNFNTKRGYYQLRGIEDGLPQEDSDNTKQKEYKVLTIQKVEEEEPDKKKLGHKWYKITYDDGLSQKVSKAVAPIIGTTVESIITTTLDKKGNIKKNKEGNPKITVSVPKEDNWGLIKKRSEQDIDKSKLTVGAYIYEHILSNPNTKVQGKLIHTIERRFYKEELEQILNKQCEFIPELRDADLYEACICELYKNNKEHRKQIAKPDFVKLFVDDIIFYQRPLKSKKSLIANCPLEVYHYKDKDGTPKSAHIKCIPKSHPLYEEFRLWQFIEKLRIYKREDNVNGKVEIDRDVTSQFITSQEDICDIFDFLHDKKEIKQDKLLKQCIDKQGKNSKDYRWNYIDGDEKYPCCPTRYEIAKRIKSLGGKSLAEDETIHLWHILYSVDDVIQYKKALSKFATAHNLPSDKFIDAFLHYTPENKSYGAYSEKAIKRLLTLMRQGRYWDEEAIDHATKQRLFHIIDGTVDDNISNVTREKLKDCHNIEDFQGLPLWKAGYAIYDRHSETADTTRWQHPEDIDAYLKEELTHNSLRNPIVEKVICETLRTVRDIWKQYGKIDEVHVEMGRDLKLDAQSRARITNTIQENERTNLRIRALLQEFANPDYEIENVRPYSPSQQELLKIYEDGVLNDPDSSPDDDILKIIKDLGNSKTMHISHNDVLRYKMWLDQKYKSPYTGEVIPLSKLFTSAYEIEHIIPQSRYFDDSFSNKVICESCVNKKKSNRLAYQFICEEGGSIIAGEFGETHHILSKEQYEQFVKEHYAKNRTKMRKLLLEDIPAEFNNRQLNDTRYMSKKILNILSCLVREEGELESTSKHVIPTNGAITDRLKKDWGIHNIWNSLITPRFERLNQKEGSSKYGEWVCREGKRYFQINVPLEISANFSKKRIDYRHHAMDATIIACTTRTMVNYLNNANAAGPQKGRIDLRNSICHKAKTDSEGNYTWCINKPWDTFTQDLSTRLQSIIISFKQNQRILTRTSNRYTHYIDGKKVIEHQTKGDRWAIRKSLHEATTSGLVKLQLKKTVTLKMALEHWKDIVDKDIRQDIRRIIKSYHGNFNINTIYKYYKDRDFKTEEGKDVKRVDIFYYTGDGKDAMIARRIAITADLDRKKIGTITDSGIRKIMLAHLDKYKIGDEDHPEKAFSPEGIAEMNRNIKELNGGKEHKPIYKVRISEVQGMKFAIGEYGSKCKKFAKADKDTNLFFAIYEDPMANVAMRA